MEDNIQMSKGLLSSNVVFFYVCTNYCCCCCFLNSWTLLACMLIQVAEQPAELHSTFIQSAPSGF